MAVVRRTITDLSHRRGRVDKTKLEATTEEDIRRYMIEDGEDDPDASATRLPAVSALPAAVRAKLGMSQSAFAAAIQVPVATLRNWEQGRRQLDPAARALLRVIWADPKRSLRALGSKRLERR
jgi:putative transcriptional regulator